MSQTTAKPEPPICKHKGQGHSPMASTSSDNALISVRGSLMPSLATVEWLHSMD